MRRFMFPLTILATLLVVGIARSQDSKDDAKKKPVKDKQEQSKDDKTEADVGATDPNDPDDPADPADAADGASDTDSIGNVLLEDESQDDPAEAGKRMVMQGLGLQVGAMAADIRSTDDPKARAKMEAELRETVKIAVELRKKYRQERIARLEKLIARLRKEAEKESVDTIVKQLLSGQSPAGSGTDPGDDGDDDPAADASGGTDDDSTSADDPKEGSDDPADPKSKNEKSQGAAKKDKS